MKQSKTPLLSVSLYRLTVCLAAMVGLAFIGTGCKSTQSTAESAAMATAVAQSQADAAAASQSLVLREGDAVRVNFPAAPNLNTVQAIRRDGRISLALVGEVQAAGLTPVELEKRLLEAYGPQLQTKEVTVSVESSAFPLYLTGAVLRPGKIMSDRPINALEAVMEAGGFDYKRANMKNVRVIRFVNGQQQNYQLNLKAVLAGKESNTFSMQPGDILYIPERFTWF